MDWERTRTQAGITAVRMRARVRLAISLCGIALVLIGANNLLLAPTTSLPAVIEARQLMAALGVNSAAFLADIFLMAIGAVVAWFV